MAAVGASNCFISDEKLVMHLSPNPISERGVPTTFYGHPKEPRIIYGSGNLVVVRSLDNPSENFVYRGHNATVTVAKFSPNGFWVASADETGKCRVWSWDNPEHILKIEVPVFAGRIVDLDWDPESKRIVAVGEGKTFSAKCFMWDTGNGVGEMIGHSKRITTCSYKPSRPFRIMTGGEDFKTVFFKGPPFAMDHSNTDHSKEVWSVRFSPDGNQLASVSSDKQIIFYDSKEGTVTQTIAADAAGMHTGSIMSCCWSPDSSKLLTVAMDKTAKIWDVGAGAVECEFTFSDDPQLADMQCGCEWVGDFLVSVNLAGEFLYLDPANPAAPANVVVGHQGPASTICSLPTGEFVTGGDSGQVLKWTDGVATKIIGTDAATRSTHSGKVVGVVSTPTSVVSVGWDDRVRFSSLDSMTVLSEIETNGQPTSIAGSATGLVAVGTTNNVVMFFKDDAFLFEAAVPDVPAALALLEEEELIVGCGNNVLAFALDLGNGAITQLASGDGHRGAITTIAYSPDAAYVAVGDANREVKVWQRADWSKAKVSGKWVFHTAAVKCVTWDPTSSFIVSGAQDESVFIWNVNKVMKKRQIKNAHKGGVYSAAYVNEFTVATTGHDGCIALWNLEESK